MSTRVKLVNLLVTRRCNLRCDYCYVLPGGTEDMSLDTAKRAVEDAFRRDAEDFDRLEFAFLGGEPMLCFPMIRALSEWMWAGIWPKPYLLTASSNGTCLTDESRRWLYENRGRFKISLSYDGSPDAQDRHRCGSAARVDLSFFRETWPDMPLKLTASEDGVDHLADDIIRLRESGFLVDDTIADGTPPWRESSLDALDEQLRKLCEYDLAHPGARPSRLLSVDLMPMLSGRTGDSFSCGAGHGQVTYDWAGRLGRCHLLSPLALTDAQLARLETDLARGPARPAGCETCPLDPVCPTCGANAFRRHQTCWRREERICGLFRRQLRWACVFWAKRLLRADVPEEERRLRLRAVTLAMSALMRLDTQIGN